VLISGRFDYASRNFQGPAGGRGSEWSVGLSLARMVKASDAKPSTRREHENDDCGCANAKLPGYLGRSHVATPDKSNIHQVSKSSIRGGS
jgi:hypothetical protein